MELVALVAVAVWLAALTGLLLLCIRQLGVLTVRVEVAIQGGVAAAAGPTLGFRVGDEAVAMLPALAAERRLVVLLSATCSPCQELVDKLAGGERPTRLEMAQLVLLISGERRAARRLAARLDGAVEVLLDPDATALARELHLAQVPSGALFDAGVVEGTGLIHRAEDIDNLVGGSPLPALDGS